MIRFISPVRLIATVLMSAMLLMGMTCGPGGFSIPLAEQTEPLLVNEASGSATPSAFGAGEGIAASERGTSDDGQPYSLTLQIVGGLASCGDDNSGPEYYATASRRDPAIEKELQAVSEELDILEPRINAFDKRIEPLRRRQHNTVPLSRDERRELDRLRERKPAIRQRLEEIGQATEESRAEERRLLERELSGNERALKRLEDSVPLSEEEARFLRDQTDQRGPLVERREHLRTQRESLNELLSMKTPGSLRVYANDLLRLHMMEKDVFVDDTCASWRVRLDSRTLKAGGIELEKQGRPLLRLRLEPCPVERNDCPHSGTM